MTIVYSLTFESDWDFSNIDSVFNTGEPSEPEKFDYKKLNIVAAFRGMHVSPAKHSYA